MRVDSRSIVNAWRLVRDAGRDLFLSRTADEIPALPGWDETRLPKDLVREPSITVIEALRAIELFRDELPEDLVRATLVATLPRTGQSLPATREVVRELIRGARRDLLVIGFSITDREFREVLVRRAMDGVTVTVVGDRSSGDARDLARSWPANAVPLVALQDVIPERDVSRRMHGKVIVADRRTVRIGSANFSVGGLSGNFEYGVRLEGSIGADIWRSIDELRSAGWLVSPGG